MQISRAVFQSSDKRSCKEFGTDKKFYPWNFFYFYNEKARYMSTQRKGFIGGFFENLKEEYSKSKEMKESIKKFREEAKKLEESDALKEARKKYVNKILKNFY